MSHAGFLRAIVAEPADDTARLAYADFLEETGEPAHVARAQFIRAQIEAHHLHENHPRREEVEARAEALFADYWDEWWLPVCEATGLPLSRAGAAGFRELVARFFGRGAARVRLPYDPAYGTTLEVVQPRTPRPQTTLRTVTFVRGFPESISLLGQLREVREAVHAWTTAAPLASLHLHGTVGREWEVIDGEHLRGVRELVLDSCAANLLTAVGRSRHLPAIDTLALRPDRSNAAWPAEQYRAYADSGLAARVRRLRVAVGRVAEVGALLGPHLDELVELSLGGPVSDEDLGLTAALTTGLTRFADLTNLKELSLSGTTPHFAGGLVGWVCGRLQRLAVEGLPITRTLCDLIRDDHFPTLTDLAVASPEALFPLCAALADSPLAGRLRHLRLTGSRRLPGGLRLPPEERAACVRLARALDPENLETLAQDRGVRDLPEVWGELQERFPGRVSLV